MADSNDLRELSFETAFAYQEQMDAARRAVMRASQGILPPTATLECLEYFASQWLRQQGQEDILQDSDRFNELVQSAFSVVQGFHTPMPRPTFMREEQEKQQAEPAMPRPVEESRPKPPAPPPESRKLRDLCSKLGVPYDFDDESELIEWLLTNKRYHTWLTYAKATGEGTIGDDIPRGKPGLTDWMQNRKQQLETSAAA